MSSETTPTALPTDLTALVVGGTSGIGAAIAVEIARRHPNARITVAGRDAIRGGQVVAECQVAQRQVDGSASGKIDFRPIDACKMADVERFARDYAQDVLRQGQSSKQLDVLVVSQGILTTQGRTPARPGSALDQKMALHLYSRIALIDAVISSSILAPGALVMSVLDGKNSSVNSRSISWNDLGLQKPGAYGLASAAATCLGLTDAMFQHYSASDAASAVRRTYVHAYPGFVETPLLSNGAMPGPMRWATKALASFIAVDAPTCASRLVQGAWDCKRRDVQGEASRGWWNIDDKGRVVENKAVASEEKRQQAREHTREAIAEDVKNP